MALIIDPYVVMLGVLALAAFILIKNIQTLIEDDENEIDTWIQALIKIGGDMEEAQEQEAEELFIGLENNEEEQNRNV